MSDERSLGIHWFAFTTRSTVDAVVPVVAKHVMLYHRGDADTLFVSPSHGNRGYERVLVGWLGTRISYTPGREDVYVEVPGEACEFCGSESLLKLNQLESLRLRRIDIALDAVTGPDGGRLSPRYVYDLCRTDPQRVRTAANLEGNKSVTFMENGDGQTTYIGSAQSERRMRFYDMRGPVRCELQIRGDRAEQIGEILDGRSASDLPRIGVGLLRDFVDFVVPHPIASSAQVVKSDRELEPWWLANVGDAERVGVTIERPELHIERSWKWAKLAWATTYVAFVKAAGGDIGFTDLLMREGQERFRGRHQQIVDTAGGVGGWVPDALALPA